MSFATVVMRRVVRRLVIVQLILTFVVVLGYLALQNINGSIAALFGGSITLAGTLLMAWRISRAAQVTPFDKQMEGKPGNKQVRGEQNGAMQSGAMQQGHIEIYIGALQKFILTLLLMAFGMGYLKLDPLAILTAFAMTQLSYIANKVDTSPAS